MSQSNDGNSQKYEVIDIDQTVVDLLKSRGNDSFVTRFGDYRPSTEPQISIGDSISVTIWEASAGGLFSSALTTDRLNSGSKSATIPDQTVGRDGSISVPYAGRIRVVGRTPRDVQTVLEKSLDGKAIQPQVLVNISRSPSNSVTVTGEVTRGARIPLTVSGDKILDVIATAGGIQAPVNETYIQLTRGKVTARVAMTLVTTDSRENIYMRPNDVLTVVRDPHTFIAYGATGRNAEVPFESDGITLSQALAKAGGLLDYRANPSGVFLFRYEPESVVRVLRPDSPLLLRGRLTPVVYRLDLHEANSFFLAQRFRIMSRDVLYVTNAPITELQKSLDVFNTIVSPVSAGAGLAAAAK